MKKGMSAPELLEGAGGERADEKPEALEFLGRQIGRFRRMRRMTQAELGRRAGVSRERVGNWERGANAPPPEALIALSKALGVSVDELLTGDEGKGASLDAETKEQMAFHLRALLELLER
jgi:transcriptional regulator with XRE-family HTH domain